MGRSGDGPGNARCTERNSWYPSFKDLCLWQMCIWTASLPCKVVYMSVYIYICYCYDITISVSVYFLYTYDYCIHIIIYILSYMWKIYLYTIYVYSRYIYMQLCRIHCIYTNLSMHSIVYLQIYDVWYMVLNDIWYIYICFFVLCNSIVSFQYVMTLHLLPFGSRNSPQDSATTQEQPITWIVPKERTTRCSFRFYGRRAGCLLCNKKTGQGGWTLPEN